MSTEPHVIAADDILSVWKAAYRLLRTQGNRFHLTLHVRTPKAVNPAEFAEYDPSRVGEADPLRDVATTIFPKASSRWDLPMKEFNGYYSGAYQTLLRKGRSSWGCYFLRMIAFGHERIDQLECVVRGLGTWGHNHKAAFTIHLSSAETELPKHMGAPCLQYIQFTVNSDKQLCLTAVYRAHDYFGKALGNLLGLARLLEFVAMRTNHTVGTLTCLSTYAFVNVKNAYANALLSSTE